MHSKYRTLLHPQKQLILSRLLRGLFVSYGGWRKGKRTACGEQWEGEREEARFFPLPSPARFPFFDYLLGYQAGASAEKRGSFSLAKALNFVFKANSDAELFMSRTLLELRPTQTKTTTILFFVGTRSWVKLVVPKQAKYMNNISTNKNENKTLNYNYSHTKRF